MAGTFTRDDVDEAVQHLAGTERGRVAMQCLLEFLEKGGLGLDAANQDAVLALLYMAWGSYPGTVRDAIREAITKKKACPR